MTNMKYSMNIAWWVGRWRNRHPQKAALIFEDEEISYLTLHRQVCRIAAWFSAQGLRTGQRVAVLMNNCPEFIEIYLACARSGLILVPFNTRWAADEIGWAIDNAEPQILIFDVRYADKIFGHGGAWPLSRMVSAQIGDSPKDPAIIHFHDAIDAFNAEQVDTETSFHPVDPEEPHVIMYTSGTTGRPKGAVLPLRKTFFNCLNAEIFLELTPEDRVLLTIPLYHSGGLFIVSSPALYKGATIVMRSRFDASTAYRDIGTYRISKIAAVPTILKKLLDESPENRGDVSSLKICAVGGEKIPDELLHQCRSTGFPMRQIMGQTETSIILWASGQEMIERPGTVGKPVFHGQVELMDAAGNPTRPGEIGEIAVTGPTIMSGYWRQPGASEKTIRNGWLHTGDMAQRDEDGYYFLLDRSTEIYISGGENVYPAEVERVLKSHPGISDAAVLGIADDTWGETGHAFIIPNVSAEPLTEKDIFNFCEERLARFKWPKRISFCETFPRTDLGKVKKKDLIRRFNAR